MMLGCTQGALTIMTPFFEGAEPNIKLFNDLLTKHKSRISVRLRSRHACGIIISNTKPYILIWWSVRCEGSTKASGADNGMDSNFCRIIKT